MIIFIIILLSIFKVLLIFAILIILKKCFKIIKSFIKIFPIDLLFGTNKIDIIVFFGNGRLNVIKGSNVCDVHFHIGHVSLDFNCP